MVKKIYINVYIYNFCRASLEDGHIIYEYSSTSLPRRAKLSHTGKFWRSGVRNGKTIIIVT